MIERSRIDTNEYATHTLANGMRVVLVSNPRFSKSACAVSVQTGSYDEPLDTPGLAHFLEHMLFMGTAEYPGENDFMDFLSRHNGYSNAYTADDYTVYYADVDSEQLEVFARMLASFFVCPLFAQDSVAREICAVDSEWRSGLNEPWWRQHALLSEFVAAGEVRGRFSVGNSETLSKDGIWERVKEFWREKYRSEEMAVVLCSNVSLERLREVAEIFARVPSGILNGLSISDGLNGIQESEGLIVPNELEKSQILEKTDYCYFDPKFLGSVVKMEGLDGSKEVSIIVSLPPLLKAYAKNPLGAIDFVLTRGESDGLAARLKNAGLGYGLDFSYDCHLSCTMVQISVQLSAAGMARYGEVLALVWEALCGLRVEAADYARLQRIRNEDFDMQRLGDPLEIVEEMAGRLQHYPTCAVLRQPFMCDEYDAELIGQLVAELRDRQRWIVVLTDSEGEFTEKEKYYGVRYCRLGRIESVNKGLGDVVNNTVNNINNIDNGNIIIATFKLLETPGRFIKQERHTRSSIDYVYDREFEQPTATLFVILETQHMQTAAVAIELHLALAKDAFAEKYARQLVDFHIKLRTSVVPLGIQIELSGANSKLAELCCAFLRELHCAPAARANLFRKQIEDRYMGALIAAPWYALRTEFAAVLARVPGTAAKLEAIRHIDSAAFALPRDCYVNLIAVGNIDYSDVLKVHSAALCAVATADPSLPPSPLLSDNLDVPFETMDKHNNAVALFYRITDFSASGTLGDPSAFESDSPVLHSLAIGLFWAQICKDDFFNQLRTIEQLGYCVSCSVVPVARQHFLAFSIQSARPTAFLLQRIREYVATLHGRLEAMPAHTLEEHRASLIGAFEEPIPNLESLASHIRNQNQTMRADLRYEAKMIEIIAGLSRQCLLDSDVFSECCSVHSFCNAQTEGN